MDRQLDRLPRTSRLLRGLGLGLALAGAASLAACVAQPPVERHATPLNGPVTGPVLGSAPPGPAGPGRRIAILLPLTGPNAEIGQALLKAAQLSLNEPGSPPLDQQDTHGTPEGAAAAARIVLAAGAGIVLGPLTGPETSAVAPLTRAAGVPLLAFTSDATLAQAGVWPLGITPAQQVRRLVLAVQAENKTRLAAVLPQNAFGDALASGLTVAAAGAGLPEPRIVRTPNGFAALNDALKTVSDFPSRRGAIEAAQRAAKGQATPDARKDSAEIGKREIPPPPMDALLLGAGGDLLGQAVPLLGFYDIGPAQVRILGPATWVRDAPRQPNLAGAWFAAPDPAARSGFETQFTAKYNGPARDFTSLAYDAAGIARAVATAQGFPSAGLTRPEGFAGADGLLALQPDGQVRRGLAIFEVDRGGAHIVQPAPQTLAAPGV